MADKEIQNIQAVAFTKDYVQDMAEKFSTEWRILDTACLKTNV